MKHLILPIMLLALYINTFAQDVAVSEYKDAQGTPLGEWTELIILRDGTSLANCILQDNNGTDLNKWSGGIKFRDLQIWKDLRRGTIIVIHHRDIPNTVYDYDASDGYLEMPATDWLYFEMYDPYISDDSSRTWEDRALSINEERDIIELCNGDGGHIHSLSHCADVAGSVWRTLPEPKPNCPIQLYQGKSVAICPGANINSYAGTGGNNQVQICDSPTKGLPNSSDNSLLWRKLREPLWNDITAKASIGQYGARISWSKSSEVRSDTDGYLIVRFVLADSAKVSPPQDGHVYEQGEKTGVAVVVANVGGNITYDYYDNTDLPCNTPIGYRIYAYRFRNSGAVAENMPVNARGRQYLQSDFAQVSVEKYGPDVPEIFAKGDTSFCEGDSVILAVKNPQSHYEYKWLKNSTELAEISGDSIVVTASGEYSVSVVDTVYHCTAISEAIRITVFDSPIVELYANNKKVESDTSISLCSGEGTIISCRVDDINNVTWYLNGQIFKENVDRIVASETGKYSAEVANGGDCKSISPEINLIIKEGHIAFYPDTIVYNLNTQGIFETEIVLTNPDDYEISVNLAGMPANVEIASPEMPCVVPANSSISVVLNIAEGFSVAEAKIRFMSECSDDTSFVTIRGIIIDGMLSINKSEIDFGELATCETVGKSETITLANYGDSLITLFEPLTHSPFSVSGIETFPITLSKNEIKSITIRFDTNHAGIYEDTLVIPYKISGIDLREYVLLTGRVNEINYELVQTEFVLNGFSQENPTQEVTLQFKNIGGGEIKIEKPDVVGLEFPNLPISVAAGETVYITVSVIVADSVLPYTYSFDLVTEPCGTSSKVEILCTAGSIFADNLFFDFGALASCDEQNAGTGLLTLYASDTVMTVFKVEQSKDFVVDINIGDQIADSAQYNVRFLRTDPGVYRDSAKITFMPDSSVITLYYSAIVEDFVSSVPAVADMPKTDIYTASNLTLPIKNNNSYPVEIKEITGCQSPFLISNIAALPVILQPGEIFNLYLVYECSSYSESNCNITIFFTAGDCEYAENMLITGKANINDTSVTYVKLEINAPKQVQVGESVKIPVKITGTDAERLNLSELKTIAFDLAFSVRTINPNLALLNGNSLSDTMNLTSKSDSVKYCSGEISVAELTGDSVVLYLIADIYLGNSDSASLVINNVQFSGDKHTVCYGDTAVMRIVGECAFESGLLEVGGDVSGLNVKINENALEIAYKITDENPGEIQLVDVAGRIIYDKSFVLRRGEYAIIMELPPAGVYFAVLRNGNFPRFCKFVVR